MRVAACAQQGGRAEWRNEGGFCVFANSTECELNALYEKQCASGQISSQTNYATLPTPPPGAFEMGNRFAAELPSPKTVQDLLDQSQLIFIGEVGPVIQRRSFAGYDKQGEWLSTTNELGTPLPAVVPVTDFELKVNRVIKDDGAIAGGKPIILTMAGDATPELKRLTANTPYPFSYTGDRHLFLLTLNPDGKTYGFYHGPYSRLIIDEQANLHISNGTQDPLILDGETQPLTLERFEGFVKPAH